MAKVISFSGIDGAGKSTQINALKARCEEMGLRVRIVSYWEQVAHLKYIRAAACHVIFRGDQGVGSPSTPIHRKDKNIRSLPLTIVRLFLYLVDGIATRRAAKRAFNSKSDVVVFDRYIYDELANLELSRRLIRLYVRMILRFVPRPHISYILDADPLQARTRKPEYPLEFLISHRESYLELSRLIGEMTIVPGRAVDEVGGIVAEATFCLFPPNEAGKKHSLKGVQATPNQIRAPLHS